MIRRLLFITILCLSIPFAVGLSMAGELNVLIVVADSSALAESSVVQSFPQIEGNTFQFTEINIATGGTRPIAGGLIPADEVADGNLNWFDYQTLTAEGEATGIFDGVDLSGLVLDDNFANTDPAYTILATRNDNRQPAAIQLNYGRGAYIEVCVDARSTFPAAEPMVGNLLAYMASLRAMSTTSVEPSGKLPATWGDMKN